ncbi:tetratricopeptide repeat protein [Nannocystaceae bacterium ST9]
MSSSSVVLDRGSSSSFLALALALALVASLAACTHARSSSTSIEVREPEAREPSTSVEIEGEPSEAHESSDPAAWLAAAERALQSDQPARAAALFARYLGHDPAGEPARQAYGGLARAHEQLGDFEAAIRAYDGFLRHFPDDPSAPAQFGRRGACEAEIGEWERSAESYAQMLERGGDRLLAAERVEALARQGFAYFQLDRLDEADARLADADAIYESATSAGRERFGDTYFVAMARFYRAAILHLRFRAVVIHQPEAQMNADFQAKLALLEQAQDAYNRTIRARHVYWVSAAGYQLGSLFEEFYDAIMYAPVPEWLDEAQRLTYYEQLEEQLRPVVDKAIWVFERNLETARKLGYDNEFVALSEQQLERLQTVLLGRDARLGQPVPRLAVDASGSNPADDPGWTREGELPVADRKLFVPLPTPL